MEPLRLHVRWRAFRRFWALVAIGATMGPFLYGCATMPIPVGLPCNVGPIVLDKGASTRLTRAEKEQVVTLNESGAKLCQWKPPVKR